MSQIDPVHAPIQPLEDPPYYYPPLYASAFQEVSFPQISPIKSSMHLSSPPYVLHVMSISVFLTWSPEWYLVKSTEYKAPRYVVFSTPLLPHSLLGPNILLNTLFSKTLSLHSSLNVSNQVSHQYKTTGKIIVLYILIFTFFDTNRRQKILHWMIASTAWFQPTLNFSMNGIFIR